MKAGRATGSAEGSGKVMGVKPNWGAFARSLGQSALSYAERKRQEQALLEQQKREEMLYDQRRADRNEDWFARRQFDLDQQALRAGPPEPTIHIPSGSVNTPFGSFANPLGRGLEATPELQGLIIGQKMGVPAGLGDFNSAMESARKRIGKGVTAQKKYEDSIALAEEKAEIEADKQRSVIDYRESLKGEPLTQEEKTARDVARAEALAEVEINKQKRIADYRKSIKEDKPKDLTNSAISDLVDEAFPKPREFTQYGEPEHAMRAGSYLTKEEAEDLGESGVAALRGMAMKILYGGGYGVNRKNPDAAFAEAIAKFDVPNEQEFLPDNLEVRDGKLHQKSGWSWKEVAANEIRDKLFAGRKKGTVSYKAAYEIAKDLGLSIEEYNKLVPNIGETQSSEEQVIPFDIFKD